MARIEDRLARLEQEVAALPRARPHGCQPGRTFDVVQELLHDRTCRAENCARRRRFIAMSDVWRPQLGALVAAEMARRQAEEDAP